VTLTHYINLWPVVVQLLDYGHTNVDKNSTLLRRFAGDHIIHVLFSLCLTP